MKTVMINLPFQSRRNPREHRTEAMIAYIHQNITAPITIDDLCKAAYISKTKCFRCFNEVDGRTPMQVVNDCRLEASMNLLLQSAKPVSEISYSCGYNSPSYFTKLFKKKIGLTPFQYRKQRQQHPDSELNRAVCEF